MSKKKYKASPPNTFFAIISAIGWGFSIFQSIKNGIWGYLGDLASEEWAFVLMTIILSYPLFWYVYRFDKAKEEEKASQKREKAAQAAEKRKARLIKDYGEVDGMRIFNKEITEKKYKNEELPLKKAKELKAEIYKKYDKDVIDIVSPGFDNWISTIVFMDYFDEQINKFYENIELYLKLVKKYEKNIAVKLYKLSIYPPKIEELFLDMTKEMLVDSLGEPGDQKKTVTKSKITEKYYYLPRETRQYTTVYQLEVTLENDIVVGWKDLD